MYTQMQLLCHIKFLDISYGFHLIVLVAASARRPLFPQIYHARAHFLYIEGLAMYEGYH